MAESFLGKRPPALVILTNCIALNGGDAAIVDATMDALRRRLGEDARFVVHDSQPEVTSRLWPGVPARAWAWDVFGLRGRGRIDRALRPLRMARALAAASLYGLGLQRLADVLLRPNERAFLAEYASADVVVSKGGTYLVPSYDLRPHFFDYRICTLMRRPLVLYTQSVGPFVTRSHQRRMRRLSQHALVLLRDEQSAENLRDIGIRVTDHDVYADAAFTLADPAVTTRARSQRLPRSPQVAVSVRQWRHFRRVDPAQGMRHFEQAVQAMVERLVREHGAHVTFLSTCQGRPTYWTDDSRVAQAIADRLPADVRAAVSVDDHAYDTQALRTELGRFDLAVSTRLHFAILALGCGVPVFPIAYEFKTVELFTRLGLGRWVQDIESIDPVTAAGELDHFVAALDQIRGPLFVGVEEQRRTAESAADRVLAMMRRPAA
jgi:colanic acid/amylovoran biosynthesis protein